MYEAYVVVFALLGTVALFNNRIIEIAKAGFVGKITDARTRTLVLLVLSFIVGEIVAFVMNLNVVAMLPQNDYLAVVPHTIGVAITGGLLMFGANFWHELGESAEQVQKAIPVAPVTASITETTTTTASTNVVKPSSLYSVDPDAVG